MHWRFELSSKLISFRAGTTRFGVTVHNRTFKLEYSPMHSTTMASWIRIVKRLLTPSRAVTSVKVSEPPRTKDSWRFHRIKSDGPFGEWKLPRTKAPMHVGWEKEEAWIRHPRKSIAPCSPRERNCIGRPMLILYAKERWIEKSSVPSGRAVGRWEGTGDRDVQDTSWLPSTSRCNPPAWLSVIMAVTARRWTVAQRSSPSRRAKVSTAPTALSSLVHSINCTPFLVCLLVQVKWFLLSVTFDLIHDQNTFFSTQLKGIL